MTVMVSFVSQPSLFSTAVDFDLSEGKVMNVDHDDVEKALGTLVVEMLWRSLALPSPF